MSTSIPLSLSKLFEYIVAALLRASGYVAGVPIRRIGGRGTTHQIDVIGIEFSHLPFLYDTVLLVEAKCYDPEETVGIDIVRQVRSNVLDLEQTLPRNLNMLPRNLRRVQYFISVFGRRRIEEITACYRGAIFTTGRFSRYAKEFAYAHGIYLFNFPRSLAGRKVVEWIEMLRKILLDIAEDSAKLQKYFPTARGTPLDYYNKILAKSREDYSILEPEERHYLFTIIRNVLRKDATLRQFWLELRKFCLMDLNGYPVLTYLPKRRTIGLAKRILKQYGINADRKRRRRIYGSEATISNMKLVKEWSEPINNEFFEVAYTVKDEELQFILEGRTFVPNFLHESFKKNGITLVLPITEGLNLIARSFRKRE